MVLKHLVSAPESSICEHTSNAIFLKDENFVMFRPFIHHLSYQLNGLVANLTWRFYIKILFLFYFLLS